jgi:hypothetical protein
MHPAGTLYLTLRYIDLRAAYSRSASRVSRPLGGLGIGGRLFGASLESVLDRESSGFPVPLIVKRCIEEVKMAFNFLSLLLLTRRHNRLIHFPIILKQIKFYEMFV